MNLDDLLSREQVVAELRTTDRWQAIDELLDTLVACGKIRPQHRDAIAAAVKKQEGPVGTGVGFGLGVPNAATDLVSEVVVALGRSRQGVNFEALDKQPVNLVLLVLVPQSQVQEQLPTMSNIANVLHKKEFRQGLAAAPDVEAMLRVIADHR